MTTDTIAAPVAKASAALGSSAAASFLSTTTQAQSFLPTDLAGWVAVGASGAALIYSLTLLAEWWWKRVWRKLFQRAGIIDSGPSGPAPLVDHEAR